MSSPLFPAAALHAAVAARPGAFAAFGPGADVDAAFDEAVSAAGYDYGFADVLPSVTAADPSTLTCHSESPLSPDAALAVVIGHTGQVEPGSVLAVPVAATAAHARRRARVVLDDPALVVPFTEGVLLQPSAALLAALSDAGAAPADGEVLERVEIKVRARFKPVVTPNTGKTAGSFVVLDPTTGTILERGHRTASEARRAAVALAKGAPVTTLAETGYEVWKLSGREEGQPLVSVRRTRVAQKVTAKVIFATEKKPGATKVAGWLFCGVLAS